jgi:hypothetical protein
VDAFKVAFLRGFPGNPFWNKFFSHLTISEKKRPLIKGDHVAVSRWSVDQFFNLTMKRA